MAGTYNNDVFQHIGRYSADVLHKTLTWQDINTAFHSTCPLILSVFDIILSIPVTSVDYEREFSTMRQVKTDWRSKLHIITLNDCMRISLEGPSIANFDPTDTIHNWYKNWWDCWWRDDTGRDLADVILMLIWLYSIVLWATTQLKY